MTLQNRVDPWGALHAVSDRGTMMGNRGGKFHRDDRTIGNRRWASHHWICCDIHYKGLHHEAMGPGYTSLFFLDEVTALAAGHRPCFYCRRAEAKAFLGDTRVEEFDRQLHRERLASSISQKEIDLPSPPHAWARGGEIPDAAMFDINGAAYALKGGQLLRWSFAGYTPSPLRIDPMHAKLLTPPSILSILRGGYKPRWHESAFKGDGE
jgi:hypothetical protein